MKIYSMDWRELTGSFRDALDNLESSLQDLDGYFSEMERHSKGMPYTAHHHRPDFDQAWDGVQRVHSDMDDEFSKYEDDDVRSSSVNWAFVLPGGTWATVSIVLPTEIVLEKMKPADLKGLCQPYFARLQEKNEELRLPISISHIDTNNLDDEEEENAA